MKAVVYMTLIISLVDCKGGGLNAYNQGITTLFPDYAGVTVPANIAPLNFSVIPRQKALASFSCKDYAFDISSNRNGDFSISFSKWRKLLDMARGGQIEVSVSVMKEGVHHVLQTFYIHVAKEPVDPYIVYRLIEPGYALWNKMGIYQRNLENWRESSVYENKMTGYNCVNCHSFCAQNPEKMLFHLRAKHAGTVMIDGDDIEILQTKTDRTMSALVYPSWHPSDRFVAFSVNKTTQALHPTHRVEVFDMASDVVVYDVEAHTILTTPFTFSQSNFETFPTFSADGTALYFCSGKACTLPDDIQDLHYNLCSIAFNAESKTFGHHVDTIYHAATHGKSVSFPRVSPDGKYLMCTLSSYGTFPIWHKDADLYLIDLSTNEGRYPENVNSEQADSYHSWSSNSRWVVFSSRRLDGLYTRPFLVYVDENGETAKPFLLPQKNSATFYTELTRSYNIPEFVTGRIKNRAYTIMKKAKDETTHKRVQMKIVN